LLVVGVDDSAGDAVVVVVVGNIQGPLNLSTPGTKSVMVVSPSGLQQLSSM
jgi:hypothetical protein